jgi:hypothetical protein
MRPSRDLVTPIYHAPYHRGCQACRKAACKGADLIKAAYLIAGKDDFGGRDVSAQLRDMWLPLFQSD